MKTQEQIVWDEATSVAHPPHYKPSPGFEGECIEYTRQMMFAPANAFKYLFRAGEKNSPAQDLAKARWYLRDAIEHHTDAFVLYAVPNIDQNATLKHAACHAILCGDSQRALNMLDGKDAADLYEAL